MGLQSYALQAKMITADVSPVLAVDLLDAGLPARLLAPAEADPVLHAAPRSHRNGELLDKNRFSS